MVNWYLSRGPINVFSRSVNGCRQTKPFEFNFLIRKPSRWSNQAGKIIPRASQFTWCAALYETPTSEDLTLFTYASMCLLSLVVGGQIVLVPVVEPAPAPYTNNQVSANY